jgi:hypothetical protein
MLQRLCKDRSVRGTILLFAPLLFLGSILSPVAVANPVAPGVIFFHVHPYDPSYCELNPTMNCEEIVQYTPSDGELEFDLYFVGGAEELHALDLEIGWSEGWHILGFENCSPGVTETQFFSDHCLLSWTFDPPIGVGFFEPTLVGRLLMDVGGFGELRLDETSTFRSEIGEEPFFPSFGKDGVDQCYCYIA